MTKIFSGVLAVILIGLLSGYGLAWSGAINFAADQPHSKPVFQLIEWVRERSISKASSNISVPDDLNDPERIRKGSGNYDAMCVQCHLSPGTPNSEIRKGLYPLPPELSLQPKAYGSVTSEARQFWIIKHGIKGSGMPAWSKGGMDDEVIWDMVAFLQKMPQLSQSAYTQLVSASDGHSHGGLEDDHPHQPKSQTSESEQSSTDQHSHDHSDHSH